MKKLIFLRHGQSFYKDVFPDLTDEGREGARQAAKRISAVVFGQRVKIISSPSPRALGTAAILGANIYQDGVSINFYNHKDELIRPMDKYDPPTLDKYWNSFPTLAMTDMDYMTNPMFETGEIAEKQSSIKIRLKAFLDKAIKFLMEDENIDVLIAVSHTEVLSWLTFHHGIKETIKNCEEVIIYFDEKNKIKPILRFRDKSKYFSFEPLLELNPA